MGQRFGSGVTFESRVEGQAAQSWTLTHCSHVKWYFAYQHGFLALFLS